MTVYSLCHGLSFYPSLLLFSSNSLIEEMEVFDNEFIGLSVEMDGDPHG